MYKYYFMALDGVVPALAVCLLEVMPRDLRMLSVTFLFFFAALSLSGVDAQGFGFSIYTRTLTFSFGGPDDSPEPTPTPYINPLEKAVSRLCEPKRYIYNYGTDEEVIDAGVPDVDSLVKSMKDSPFPCEQMTYIITMCTSPDHTKYGTKGTVPRSVIESERACVCPSKFWEAWEACAKCESVHGYGPSYLETSIKFTRKLERRFCNATVPEMNWYWVVQDHRFAETPLPPTTGPPDQFPSKTEVSLYYTEGVRPTISDTRAPGSGMTKAMGSTTLNPTSTGEPFTRASTFDATRTGVPDGPPPSTATAGSEATSSVKAVGGVLVAIVVAIIML